ncbi:hypothetical protein ACBP45_04175 [Latilactobacillus sakei]
MYAENGALRKLTVFETLFYFIISILLNGLANALTVATNLGSAIWTASAANLASYLHSGLGLILFLYGIIVIFVNIILLRRVDMRRIIGNLIFIMPFSYLVQQFTKMFVELGVGRLSFGPRIALDLVGVVLIGVAVSIYQRVRIVLHPNDDLSYILRFSFFHGNAAIGQYVSYTLPLLVVLFCWLQTKSLVAINIGTAISLVIQGPITGWSDKHVFTHLKHRTMI